MINCFNKAKEQYIINAFFNFVKKFTEMCLKSDENNKR